MTAKRKGERIRWRVVVVLEVVKAICRLFLLKITNLRPLVTPALPEREVIAEEEPVPEIEDEEAQLEAELEGLGTRKIGSLGCLA
ncbi:hypothetical protein M7I_5089 [Glarea lozoyensis 74030]|uniref:Peroxisomal membrane protein PEX16 n=1 Tax=Glarea lozoyensis (strain ATCC 74030 / MF5533) TaxID=1104152 RepID=H0EQY0_GLAL7|nr:hypothetical protein M7I_5089 [Glarea lozoyensis 74030]